MSAWIITSATAILLGGGTWVITNFVGSPIRKFFDLRGEVIRRLIEFGNVGASRNEAGPGMVELIDISYEQRARLHQAQMVFRDLASQMRSFAENEGMAMWLVRKLGYDPMEAGVALIGLSNNYDTYGDGRAESHERVKSALRIKWR